VRKVNKVMPTNDTGSRSGFTLIELLVVIAIIGGEVLLHDF
jgi:prepilin-type N-terminal cleavage/methylation domain-containing protein